MLEIDWNLTKERIRSLFAAQWDNQTTEKVLGETLCYCGKNIKYLLYGKSKINLSDLVLIARYFDIELSELLVLKPFARDDILGSLQAHHPDDCEDTKSTSETHNIAYYDCFGNEISIEEYKYIKQHAADFAATVLLNDAALRDSILRDLKRYLLYIPLVDLVALKDFFLRIQGNLSSRGEEYLRNQLRELYQSIPESLAKSYADNISLFDLSYPSVFQISDTSADNERQKLSAYINWVISPDAKNGFAAYKQSVDTLIARLDILQHLEDTQKHAPSDCG